MPILNWLTRDEDIEAAKHVPYRLLEEVPDLSYGEPDRGNMLIQGDNLEALKALLPFYAGQVKCIYIDPPYNTKSAFEHFNDNLEHSQWLAMIWPRLELLRDLLAENGSIWVNIEDHEGHYLKVIMDEIFGRRNFLQTIVWNRKVSPANDAQYFSNDHDYIYVYAKSIGQLEMSKLQREDKHNKSYTNPDNDPRGRWNSLTFTGNKNKNERPNLYYPITNPNTGEELWPPKNLTWRYSRERAEKMIAEGRFYFGKDGTSRSPRVKQYLKDAKPVIPRSVWGYDDAGHTQQSMTEIKALFEDPFGTPKPEKLVRRILSIATNPGELVLDSFLGSGTTCAVAQKMGRRYLGIEMGDHAVSHCQVRLREVVDGEQGGISEAQNWKGGSGFRFYRLGAPAFDENGRICADIRFPVLAAHVWFSETRLPWQADGKSPVLGIHDGTAYALLYNGILGDKRADGGNVLTSRTLKVIRDQIEKMEKGFSGPVVIYGESSRIGQARRARANVTFKQTPYDVKAR